MKDSEILKAAKGLIESGKHVFICFALDQVADDYADASHRSVQGLLRWVGALLGTSESLDDWLHDRYNTWRGDDDVDYFKRTRITRLAWLDWMIAQCEEQEKE